MKFERTYFENGSIKTECETINGKKHGVFIRYYENGNKAIESNYVNGLSEGTYREWYENGQIAEIGNYTNGEYFVTDFWTDDGIQLLKNGNGKTIRKYGTTDGDIYEQYFDDGKFIGEKKIAGVIFGKFIAKK